MRDQLQERQTLADNLHAAIHANELEPYIQAQTDASGAIRGGEMLLRWTRADGKRISPSQFIPIAEDSDLILTLGNQVMTRGCELLARWASQPRLRNLVLAVNVSAKQFDQHSFVADVSHILDQTGADPTRLKLEITESVMLGDLDDVRGKLTQLRARGVRFSLDDFGTGYSSLSYISHLPLDELKIDHAFVVNLPHDRNAGVVAQTILALGQRLGIAVVAEGVETTAQHEFLARHGCTTFQGFLFARPVPITTFEHSLTAFSVMPAPPLRGLSRPTNGREV